MSIDQSGAIPGDHFEFVEAAGMVKADRDLSLTLILAQSLNGVIGRDGDLPWRIPEDLAMFKQATMGGTLIMGRRTFDSINRVLPGRTMIVISSQVKLRLPDGVAHARTPLGALELAPREKPVFVIGGARVYDHFLDAADEILVTLVKDLVPGDTHFDTFERCSPTDWEIVERSSLNDTAELLQLRRRS